MIDAGPVAASGCLQTLGPTHPSHYNGSRCPFSSTLLWGVTRMLSTTAEYALRMMVLLAGSKGHSTTCGALSKAGHIPQQYASKVLNTLRRAGMVKGQRGRYGGFVLGCDPTQATLLDVVNAIDPVQRTEKSPGHQGSPVLVLIDQQIDRAIGQMEKALGETTLSNLVGPNLSTPISDDSSVVSARMSLGESVPD